MFNPLNFLSKFIKSNNEKELDRIKKIVSNNEARRAEIVYPQVYFTSDNSLLKDVKKVTQNKSRLHMRVIGNGRSLSKLIRFAIMTGKNFNVNRSRLQGSTSLNNRTQPIVTLTGRRLKQAVYPKAQFWAQQNIEDQKIVRRRNKEEHIKKKQRMSE